MNKLASKKEMLLQTAKRVAEQVNFSNSSVSLSGERIERMLTVNEQGQLYIKPLSVPKNAGAAMKITTFWGRKIQALEPDLSFSVVVYFEGGCIVSSF